MRRVSSHMSSELCKLSSCIFNGCVSRAVCGNRIIYARERAGANDSINWRWKKLFTHETPQQSKYIFISPNCLGSWSLLPFASNKQDDGNENAEPQAERKSRNYRNKETKKWICWSLNRRGREGDDRVSSCLALCFASAFTLFLSRAQAINSHFNYLFLRAQRALVQPQISFLPPSLSIIASKCQHYERINILCSVDCCHKWRVVTTLSSSSTDWLQDLYALQFGT